MSTWRVEKVTEEPGMIVAELVQVEWFKPNPDWDRLVEANEDGTEFIDALPGEEDADCIEARGRLTLDITEGPELHPLDNVELNVWQLVETDA